MLCILRFGPTLLDEEEHSDEENSEQGMDEDDEEIEMGVGGRYQSTFRYATTGLQDIALSADELKALQIKRNRYATTGLQDIALSADELKALQIKRKNHSRHQKKKKAKSKRTLRW